MSKSKYKPSSGPPPEKPQPPDIVVIREDQTTLPVVTIATPTTETAAVEPTEPPLTITYEALTPQNNAFLMRACRRLKELMLDAQKRKSRGRLVVSAFFEDGQLNGKGGVDTHSEEHLGR